MRSEVLVPMCSRDYQVRMVRYRKNPVISLPTDIESAELGQNATLRKWTDRNRRIHDELLRAWHFRVTADDC